MKPQCYTSLIVQWLLNLFFHTSHKHLIQDLVTHFQDNSLSANFPAIATKLLHPYHEEIGRLEGT